jgi:hypothetical protein
VGDSVKPGGGGAALQAPEPLDRFKEDTLAHEVGDRRGSEAIN